MRRIAIGLVLLAVATAAAAQDRSPVILQPGEAITLRLDGEGATIARENPGPADWTSFDLNVARRLSGLTPPRGPVPAMALPNDGSLPSEPAVGRDRLRLRFLSIADQHSLLILENGYDRGLVFRARITREGTARPTDVCLVVPMHHGFEHWPYRTDRIEVSDFHLVPWREGDPVPCA